MTSPFIARKNPVTGKDEFHNGIDIACEIGTPVAAVDSGRVIDTGVSATFGRYLKYEVRGGYFIFYAHLNEVLVKEGETVFKGQAIAKSGNTGRTTGPHLHLTVYDGGVETDPLLFFEYAPE